MFSLQKRAEQHPVPPLVAKYAEENDGHVWYFGYGSNMNKDVLCKRRGCAPQQSVPVVCKEWILLFGLAAMPYLEPGMATIVKRNQFPEQGADRPDVVGVAHKLSVTDFVKVLLTEGAPSTEHPDSDVGEVEKESSSGYHLIPLRVTPTDGGEPFTALTLTTTNPLRLKPDALCSKRYINLLITGAKTHSLPEDYIKWLETRDYYRPTIAKRGAGVVFIGMLVALALPMFFFARVAEMIYPTNPDAWLRKGVKNATENLFNLASFMEKWMSKVVGSGFKNETPPPAVEAQQQQK